MGIKILCWYFCWYISCELEKNRCAAMASLSSVIDPTSTKHRSTVVIVVQKSPTPQRFRAFLMMQEWADYLDRLKAGADVIPITGKVA